MDERRMITLIMIPLWYWLLPPIINAAPQYYNTGYGMNEDSSLIIRTTKGLIRGQRVKSSTGKLVNEYLNIPYAKPPIGKLRFRHPRPMDAWQGIFNATTPPNSCYQLNDTTFGEHFGGTKMWNANTNLDEDCLKINIWVPHPRPQNSPVLVWIYGGAFNTGTITLSLYDGKILASEENIIVVSFNYRVANLGFLYFHKARHEAPGNAGMFDQIMALQWIHNNIRFFGGNPDNITLFGESAGATSISYHLISPLSQNLFSQAILQSGAPTVPWGLTDSDKINHRGLLLAKAVGCPHDENDLDAVMECLRNTDPISLVSNETNEDYGVVEFTFTPIVDGVFIDSDPNTLLNSKQFKKTKLLLGSNSEEGSYFVIYKLTEFFKNSEDVFLTREDFNASVRSLTPDVPPIGQDAIIYEYTDWLNPDDPIKNRDAIDKIVGDYYFTCHVNKLADRYASVGNEVYMYYFTYRSTQNPWPKWMGTMHGYEIAFIFGEPLNSAYSYPSEEIELSKKMMKCWANFAKTGNPTINENGMWSQLNWPLYTNHKKEYLTFSPNYTVGQGPRAKQCAFWQTFLPQLMSNLSSFEKKINMCHNAAYSITLNGYTKWIILLSWIPLLLIFADSKFLININ